MSTKTHLARRQERIAHLTVRIAAILERHGGDQRIKISYLGGGILFIIGEGGCRKRSFVSVPVLTADNDWVRCRVNGLIKQFETQGWALVEKRLWALDSRHGVIR